MTDKVEDMYCAVVPDVHGVIIDGILSSNCSEKPLPDKGVCMLASLNLDYLPNLNDENFHPYLKDICCSVVRFMDNVVQYEIDNDYKSPLKEQLKVIKDLREIGIGVTNLHKWLYNNNIEYDSKEAVSAVNELFKYLQYYCFKTSCELAESRGPCPAWSSARETNSLKETVFLKNLFLEFNDLKDMFYSKGIRNGAILSVAPCGSLSLTFPEDCISSGIEPTIGYAYWRRTRAISKNDYDYYFVLPSVVKDIVLNEMEKNENINIDDYNTIKNFTGSALDQNGVIGKNIIEIVKRYINVNLLKPAHSIDPFIKVDLMSKAQKWIDAAISVTYNLPENFEVEKIGQLYLYAWEQQLKCLSIYREGSREGVLIFDDPVTHRKKYDINNHKDLEYPENIKYHLAPKRLKELKCNLHHCSVKGEEWIVLVGLLGDVTYELFAGKKNEFFNISNNIKEGVIIKNGSKYTLKIPYRNSFILYEDITELFMNEEYKSLTRMISLALRHGVYHDHIITQLKKSSSYISDFMSVVSRVLGQYAKRTINVNDKYKCPICSEYLVTESGCSKCLACGYAKCD